MRHRGMGRCAVLTIFIAACGRDFTVPPQPVPPHLDSISPAQGFAGDVITLSGSGLGDPALSVFFDVRSAVILTPPTQRNSESVQVQVPQDVLGSDVSVSTTQGTAKASQPFTYLGLGHPRSVALRATVSLAPTSVLTFPLSGGMVALLDGRYGTVLAQRPNGYASLPAQVGTTPVMAFGSASTAWVLDAPDGSQSNLRRVDLTGARPVVSASVPVDGAWWTMAASPSAARFASAIGTAIELYALPGGALTEIRVTGATAPIESMAFASESTIVGVTSAEPFRVDLGSSPSVEVGAPFSSNQAPGAISRATLDPNGGRLAYITEVGVGLLTWGASGAPVAGAVFDPKVAPTFLAFSADGTRLLVGDGVNGVIAVCDPASGKVVGAQDAPSLVSLARIPDGPNQGFFVAGANGGSALVLPSGQILLTSFIGVDMRGIAVDAACGNVLVASAFGPLQIPAGTLAAQALDGSLALDGVQTSGGGVVGWSGADLYAFVPPANCLGKGSFKLVASASQSVLQAALSANGKWVASSDGVKLELIPRTDNGAGLQKQSIDFDSPAFTPVRYAGDSLTVGHPVAGGGFAVSTYAKGTLQETAALTLQGDPTHLDRVRFAQAWIIDVPQFQDFVQVATLVTIWDEKQGVLATASVPYAFTEPAGLSADGFMLAGISTTNSGIDTLLLQVLGTRLVQEPGPHVDLPSTPQQVLPSPDGSRLYISMPNAGAVAVIE